MVKPVVITSISIKPVSGSVAADYEETFINLNASSTSSIVTVFLNLILAYASLNLIADSNYLVVHTITFLD